MAKLRAIRNSECCARCHFVIEVEHPASTPANRVSEFYCHRGPPTVQPSYSEFGCWPKVGENDWCGEYKRIHVTPKPEQEDDFR